MQQQWLDDLVTFLQFPSVSTQRNHDQDVRNCAIWLQKKLAKIGLNSSLEETAGHPVVVAQNNHQPNRPTLLIYGHYDVQPVDPLALWDNPPFEPVIKNNRIWARGATDNKGQMLAHILGTERYLQTHTELPINLTFLFEGEEEIGSPSLPAFLKQHQQRLACDIIAISDTGMVAPNTPTLGYGLRGVACCNITIRTANRDLHSGIYGGACHNAAQLASQLAASFHDEDHRICIEGFYDDVLPPAQWEKDMWSNISQLSPQQLQAEIGAKTLTGEKNYSMLEQLWARPTAEINGVYSGYQGEGHKTVIPSEAHLKVSFRLVPQQQPAVINQLVAEHIAKVLPKDVSYDVEFGNSGKPYLADPHSTYGKKAQQALYNTFHKKPVLIREGGSIPIVTDMQEILQADSLLLGLALGDAYIHAPNENFLLENFYRGIELNQQLITLLADS